MYQFPFCFVIIFCFLTSDSNAQQMYSGNVVHRCSNNDENGPSPAFLYTCNGEKQSCPAFLIFRSQPSYDSVPAISNLTASDPVKLAQINNVSTSRVFPLDKAVIIPVNCSCSGPYYQSNASYVVQTDYESYHTIANDTYEGLTTCDSLIRENVYSASDVAAGLKLQVPIRCACPTGNQTENGTKYLLTYLVTWDESVDAISKRFNVSSVDVAYANGLTAVDATIYPFTTILVPLPSEPSSSQTQTYHYPSVIPPPFISVSKPDNRSWKFNKTLLIGIGTGVSVAFLCFILLAVFLYHKRYKIGEAPQENIAGERKWVLPKHLLAGIAGAEADQVLKVYEFEELEAATENFNPQKRLGSSVYEGLLRERKKIVIKKMSTDISKEVKIHIKISHFNLISLYGACDHQGVFYLIYEFMENGSLKDWLRLESCPEILGWNHRIRIALDVAKGIHYLHNFTYPAYVHKDINSSNILLSRDLRAKITNFSLAKSAEREENGNSSIRCDLGIKGYMAPEYVEACIVTPKLDVYAYGVVLLELITGREPVFKQNGEDVLLSEAVIRAMDGSNRKTVLSDLLDPRLQVKHPLGFIIDQTEIMLRMVKLSLACLEQEPSRRLSMSEVVSTLMKIQLDVQRSEF